MAAKRSKYIRVKCPIPYCKEDGLLHIARGGDRFHYFCPFGGHSGFVRTTDKDADVAECFKITEAQLLELKERFKKGEAELEEVVTAKSVKEKVKEKVLTTAEIESLLQEEIKSEKRTASPEDGKGARRDRTANRTGNGGDEELARFYAGLRQEMRELDRKHEVV